MTARHTLDAQNLVDGSGDVIVQEGKKIALELFHAAASRVPAYKKFLIEHNVDPKSIKTVADFEKVPPVTKSNYLRKYPLRELIWDGDIQNAEIINKSSGSSGQPFFWPSNSKQRNEVSEFHDLVFDSMFNMRHKKTLLIVAYGMGSWVAGTTTLLSTASFMEKYPCTIITPGYNKKEVIEICREIGREYEQIVICAYPPLVKEIIDLGRQEGIDWPKLQPKFIFGAEGFSEDFRNYVLECVGSKNPLLDTMNTIGSADAMVIGHETPLSVALRRELLKHDELRDDILGRARMPTVAQYYPWQKNLESVDGELYITSDGVMPLVRYNIQDNVKIYTHAEMSDLLRTRDYKELGDILPVKLKERFDWKLPFVLLYGKSTNAVKFYGAMIYPENVKAFLELSETSAYFTGKFRMQVYEDADLNQKLKLVIEMSPGVDKSQVASARDLKTLFAKEVMTNNNEYRAVYTDIQRKALPSIQLVSYGRFEMAAQNKHRYVA